MTKNDVEVVVKTNKEENKTERKPLYNKMETAEDTENEEEDEESVSEVKEKDATPSVRSARIAKQEPINYKVLQAKEKIQKNMTLSTLNW